MAECISQDLLTCIRDSDFAFETDLIVDRILGWAFLFEDNPRLLGRNENLEDGTKGRWERRFTRVDNEWAAGFYALRTFLPSLVARTSNLRGRDGADQKLSQFFILYQDNNDNDEIDGLDKFGINIQRIVFSPEFFIIRGNLPEDEARTLRESFSDIEATVNSTVLGILKSFEPSAASVAEINTFFERMYSNMKAVENENFSYEPIPINSFNTVFQDFLLGFFSGDLPNFMDFDLRSYFVDGRPFRDFVPRWHLIQVIEPSNQGDILINLAEFLLDSDDYSIGGTTTTIRPANIDAYDGTLVAERGVFQGTYNGGSLGQLQNIGWASDCINGDNLTSIFSSNVGQEGWPVVYLNLPEPTFNGLINVNLGAWDPYYSALDGNGSACVGDVAGRQLATNYSLSKAMWMYVDYFIDNFEVVQLLGLLGAPKQ